MTQPAHASASAVYPRVLKYETLHSLLAVPPLAATPHVARAASPADVTGSAYARTAAEMLGCVDRCTPEP